MFMFCYFYDDDDDDDDDDDLPNVLTLKVVHQGVDVLECLGLLMGETLFHVFGL